MKVRLPLEESVRFQVSEAELKFVPDELKECLAEPDAEAERGSEKDGLAVLSREKVLVPFVKNVHVNVQDLESDCKADPEAVAEPILEVETVREASKLPLPEFHEAECNSEPEEVAELSTEVENV